MGKSNDNPKFAKGPQPPPSPAFLLVNFLQQDKRKGAISRRKRALPERSPTTEGKMGRAENQMGKKPMKTRGVQPGRNHISQKTKHPGKVGIKEEKMCLLQFLKGECMHILKDLQSSTRKKPFTFGGNGNPAVKRKPLERGFSFVVC